MRWDQPPYEARSQQRLNQEGQSEGLFQKVVKIHYKILRQRNDQSCIIVQSLCPQSKRRTDSKEKTLKSNCRQEKGDKNQSHKAVSVGTERRK